MSGIVTVEVKGVCGSGKTTVAAAIVRLLQEAGVDVHVSEMPDSADLKALLSREGEPVARLGLLAKGRAGFKVAVKETQLARGAKVEP